MDASLDRVPRKLAVEVLNGLATGGEGERLFCVWGFVSVALSAGFGSNPLVCLGEFPGLSLLFLLLFLLRVVGAEVGMVGMVGVVAPGDLKNVGSMEAVKVGGVDGMNGLMVGSSKE